MDPPLQLQRPRRPERAAPGRALARRLRARSSTTPRRIGLGDRLEDGRAEPAARFDTGHWTNYSPGNEAPLKYHLYHVELAESARPAHERPTSGSTRTLASTATAASLPPSSRGARARRSSRGPRTGYRDSTTVSSSGSRRSRPRASRSAGGRTASAHAARAGTPSSGSPGRRAAGVVPPGRHRGRPRREHGARRSLRPIRIAVDRRAARRDRARRAAAASPGGRRTNATPWVRPDAPARPRRRRHESPKLGRRPLSGLASPARSRRVAGRATLVVADSSGNRTRVALGQPCRAALDPRLPSAAVDGLTETVTSWIADYGLYAIFFLSLIDAVLPAASELVMVYGGALAAGAFSDEQADASSASRSNRPAGRSSPSRPPGRSATSSARSAAGRSASTAGRPYLERHGRWLHVTPAKLDKAEPGSTAGATSPSSSRAACPSFAPSSRSRRASRRCRSGATPC